MGILEYQVPLAGIIPVALSLFHPYSKSSIQLSPLKEMMINYRQGTVLRSLGEAKMFISTPELNIYTGKCKYTHS